MIDLTKEIDMKTHAKEEIPQTMTYDNKDILNYGTKKGIESITLTPTRCTTIKQNSGAQVSYVKTKYQF